MIHSLSWANSGLIFRLAHFVNFPVPKKQHSMRVESFGMRYTPRKTNIEPQQLVVFVDVCSFPMGLSQISCHFLGWCFFPSLQWLKFFLGSICAHHLQSAPQNSRETQWSCSQPMKCVEQSLSTLARFKESDQCLIWKSYHESSHERSVPKSVPPKKKM